MNSRLKSLLQQLPSSWQNFSDFTPCERAYKGYEKTTKATCKSSWEVSVFFPPLQNITCYKDTPYSTDNERQIRYRITGETCIQDITLLFTGILLADGNLLWSAKTALKQLPDSFLGKNSGWCCVDEWVTLLPLSKDIYLNFLFQFTHSGIQVYNNVGIQINKTYKIEGTSIALDNPYLEINFARGFQKKDMSTLSGTIGGTLKMEKKFDVQIHLSPTQNASLQIDGTADNPLPGPGELLKTIGFTTEGDRLKKAIKNTPFLKNLHLNSATVDFNFKTKKFISGTLSGQMEFSGYTVQFNASYPNLTLTANLSPKTPIEIGKILKNQWPDLGGVPKKLKVNDAAVQLTTDPLSFDIKLTLSDIWKIKSDAITAKFQKLSLQLNYSSKKVLTGNLQAFMTLGEVDFNLLAKRTVENRKTGWVFKSYAGRKKPVPLQSLLNHLAKMFGLNAPNWMPDIDLSDINIDLNTLKNTFELKARAKIKDRIGPFLTSEIGLHLKIDKANKVKPIPFMLKVYCI